MKHVYVKNMIKLVVFIFIFSETEKVEQDKQEEELLLIMLLLRRRKQKRRSWVHEINKKRKDLGEFHRLIQELREDSKRLYFNYKGTFSIVLMALVDAEYCFIAVDIGNYGSNSDGAIFRDSKLGKGLENGSLHVPNANTIPDAPEFREIPFMVVGDPAFPLKPYLMRPYPGRNLENSEQIYNYRLSRARRVSENAFGILTQRWRVYQHRLNVNTELAMDIVKATCVLHNFLQKERTSSVNNGEQSIENIGENRGGLTDIPASMISGNRNKKEAKRIRESLKDYFCSEKGAVEWQG